MSTDPKIPSTAESDPDVQATPAGLTQELEEDIQESDAEVGPDANSHDDADDPDDD